MAFIFFCVAVFGIGVWCLARLDPQKKLGFLVSILGALFLGLIVSGFCILVFSLLFHDLNAGTVVGVGIPVALLAWRRASWKRAWIALKEKWNFARRHARLREIILCAIGYAFLFALVSLIGIQAMRWDSAGFAQSSFMGWGDGAYHLDAVMSLSRQGTFSLQEPIAGGAWFRYPFLVEFLTAVLMRLGVPIAYAWHIPTLVAAFTLVSALWALGYMFLRKHILAFALVFLVLCGSGLGFAWLYRQTAHDAQAVGWVQSLEQNIQNPKFEYTHLDMRTGGKTEAQQSDANIAWIVPIISFFAHQRSFVLGGALGVLFLYGFSLYQEEKTRWRWMILLGLLPLVHTHTFVALALVVFVWLFYERAWRFLKDKQELREIVFSGALALALALPQLFFILRAPGADAYSVQPWFAWTMCTHRVSWLICDAGAAGIDTNPVWFWFKNFGIIFLTWIIASVMLWRARKDVRVYIIASWVLFAIGNLVKLQPWEFDNNKLLFWWWVLAILLSLHLFVGLPANRKWRMANGKSQMANGKWQIANRFAIRDVLLAIFVLFASLSGAVDVWARVHYGFQILPNRTHFGYYTNIERVVASWIRTHTNAEDIFLTSTQPAQFTPMLSGRTIYLGYQGWLWSHGYGTLVQDRIAVIRAFLRSGNASVLCSQGVRYWLVDGDFVQEYSANKAVNPAPWNATQSVFTYQDGSQQWDIRKLDCK